MGLFFPVNCILLSAEDSREGICKGLDWNLSLLLPLSLSLPLLLISSLSGLLILFLPFLDVLHLQSHDCWEGMRPETRPREAAINKNCVLTAEAGRGRIYKYGRASCVLYISKKESGNFRGELLYFIYCQQRTTVLLYNIQITRDSVTQSASPHIHWHLC